MGNRQRARRRVSALGIVLLLASGLSVLLAVPASAATDVLYASPSGTGGCTSTSAACSIAAAVTEANGESAGDTVDIELADGTYSIGSTLNIDTTDALTLEAESGATPVLDGRNSVGVLEIDTSGATVTIDGLTIEHGNANGQGGAIYVDGTSTVTVENSTVTDNTASVVGGGIYGGGSTTVEDSTVTDNSVTANNAHGAGIFSSGPLTVEDSTVSGNHGADFGGGIYTFTTSVVIADSTIADNTAADGGGGIATAGDLTVENSTIADNSAGSGGGGIWSNANGIVSAVVHSTIVGNSGNPGGLYFGNGASFTLAGTIIAKGSGGGAGGSGADCGGDAFTDDGYNLDDDGTCNLSSSTGSVSGSSAAADFDSAGLTSANGGTTATVALGLDNPAIGLIPNNTVTINSVDYPLCPATDQRGVGVPSGSRCDAGAVQLADQSISFGNPGSQTLGTSPTLTATASSNLAVSFTSATSSVCTVTTGGVLTLVTTGTCTIDANQGGDTNWNTAAQVAQSFTVAQSGGGGGGGGGSSPSASTTTLSSSLNPATVSQSVTFTATVSGSSPAGTVTFFDNGTPLGSANLTGASASYTTSNLSVGTHTITASYSGDADNASSTSPGLSETIIAATPPTTSPTTTPTTVPAVALLTLASKDGSTKPKGIDLSFRCVDAACTGEATLSVARHRQGGGFSHPAVARGAISLQANRIATALVRDTAFGKALLVRVSPKSRFHVTLVLLMPGRSRRVYPVYLDLR